MTTGFVVNNRRIGGSEPCFVIAEAGLNHNGDLDLALRLVTAARKAGADAIKFQKRTTNKILTRAAFDAPYTGENSFGKTYGEHRNNLEFSSAQWRQIVERCNAEELSWFATPWDEESADFLEELGTPLFKIASADVTNLPLLKHVAAKGKPVLCSSGMSSQEELETAISTLEAINGSIAVLHCVSAYPFEAELANLRVITGLQGRYPNHVIGYSGHEKSGLVVSLAAVALGAKIVERHFTLDRTLRGPDHAASLEPAGFSQLVENIRKVESALGDGIKRILPEEIRARTKLGKSVTAARIVKSGQTLTRGDLVLKSPGSGIPGGQLERLVGAVAQQDLDVDDQLPLSAREWPRAVNK
jgi:sialic acid synthase